MRWLRHPGINEFFAQMAELVDALVSGTSIRKYVQVRVLFWAQGNIEYRSTCRQAGDL